MVMEEIWDGRKNKSKLLLRVKSKFQSLFLPSHICPFRDSVGSTLHKQIRLTRYRGYICSSSTLDPHKPSDNWSSHSFLHSQSQKSSDLKLRITEIVRWSNENSSSSTVILEGLSNIISVVQHYLKLHEHFVLQLKLHLKCEFGPCLEDLMTDRKIPCNTNSFYFISWCIWLITLKHDIKHEYLELTAQNRAFLR